MVLVFLVIFSAMFTAAEKAFFSLNKSQLSTIKNLKSKTSETVLKLLGNPKKLLATVFVGNSLSNISIVVIILLFLEKSIPMDHIGNWTRFIANISIISGTIIIFGEILPKLLIVHYKERILFFLGYPLSFFTLLFNPITAIISKTSGFVDHISSKKGMTLEDFSELLNFSNNENSNEEDLIKGIVKLKSTDVKKILVPRTDTISLPLSTSFSNLKEVILETGYSRIPIYKDSFDNIRGILYVKDLIPHLNKTSNFKWQTLIRSPYFVPESKKIDDLLEEFQKEKVHMAIVIDEYGGTSGIVTMEDILEEIVGEIDDELDSEETEFIQTGDNTYIFEGKFPLSDFYKILSCDPLQFEKVKGDADSLAGLLLELKGTFPEIDEEINFDKYTFQVIDGDLRRIKKIKLTINDNLQLN